MVFSKCPSHCQPCSQKLWCLQNQISQQFVSKLVISESVGSKLTSDVKAFIICQKKKEDEKAGAVKELMVICMIELLRKERRSLSLVSRVWIRMKGFSYGRARMNLPSGSFKEGASVISSIRQSSSHYYAARYHRCTSTQIHIEIHYEGIPKE